MQDSTQAKKRSLYSSNGTNVAKPLLYKSSSSKKMTMTSTTKLGESKKTVNKPAIPRPSYANGPPTPSNKSGKLSSTMKTSSKRTRSR